MQQSVNLDQYDFINNNEKLKGSDQYRVINTRSILDHMQNAGYNVTDVQAVQSTTPQRQRCAKHLIRLRHHDATPDGDTVPEVVLINSHDQRSSYRLMAGLYRFVCANGIIVGQTFDAVKIRHRDGAIADQVLDRSNQLINNMDDTFKIVNDWRQYALNPYKMQSYFEHVNQALDLNATDPSDFGTVNRYEDNKVDLYTTFNRAQENILKGRYTSKRDDGTIQHRRKVGSIDKRVKVNRALWDATIDFQRNN